MAKRSKRIKTGIESIKNEIAAHFKKIEEDIENKDFETGRYHIKEINRSLINALKNKLKILGKEDEDIKKYEEKIKELENKLGK
jgi:hypothetical protein